ncbi:hypothetical protein FJY94_03125 [Candidatus Kaiserbacteria bacterium]|nr:hypothetical protein [Candidatus Kaiserbacteria bacterium]
MLSTLFFAVGGACLLVALVSALAYGHLADVMLKLECSGRAIPFGNLSQAFPHYALVVILPCKTAARKVRWEWTETGQTSVGMVPPWRIAQCSFRSTRPIRGDPLLAYVGTAA